MSAGPAWLAAAIPVSTKIPVPIILPMPMKVRSKALRQGRSRTESSVAGSLRAKGFNGGRFGSMRVDQHVFGRRHGARQTLVDLDGMPQRPRRTLEAGFNNVVAVFPVQILDVQANAGILRQRLKPFAKQFGIHFADFWPRELDLPYQVRPVRNVDGDSGQRFVHRHEARPEAPNSGKIAKCPPDRLADDNGRIFRRVVEIHVQVPLGPDLQVDSGMPGETLQHVIQEAYSGVDVVNARS